MTTVNTYKFLDFESYVNISGNWNIKRIGGSKMSSKYRWVKLSYVLCKADIKWVDIEDDVKYSILGVHANGKGVYINKTVYGRELHMKRYQKSEPHHLFFCKVRTVNGQWGVVYPEYADTYASSNMQYLKIDLTKLNPRYLELLLGVKRLTDSWDSLAIGAANRHFPINTLLNLEIPLPSLDKQNELVKHYNDLKFFVEMEKMKIVDLDIKSSNEVIEALGLQPYPGLRKKKLLQFSQFKNLYVWSAEQILYANISPYGQSKYDCKRLSQLALINPKTDLSTLHDDDELSFIPMEDISNIYGEWHKKKVGTKSQTKGYTKFQNGDIIWARITPCMQNGKSALIDDLVNGKGYGSTEFHVVRLKSNEVIPQYIHTLLRHQWVLYDAKKYFTGSAGQQRVPASYLSNLLIPVPPLDVQQKIVDNYNEGIQIIKLGYAKIKEYTCDIKTDFETQIFE